MFLQGSRAMSFAPSENHAARMRRMLGTDIIIHADP